MNRRQFISKSAAALALGSIAGSIGCAGNEKQRRIGIQLYSVRNDLPNDFEGVLKKLSEIGFSSVETYGFNGERFGRPFGNRTMQEVDAIVRELGMSISGSHCSSRILPENTNAPEWDYWKKCADQLKSVGAKWIVQSTLPQGNDVNTIDDLMRISAHFNRVGEICRQSDMRFGFHTHRDVFDKIDDEIVIEYIIKNTDSGLFSVQLDMGHVVNGGGDIMYLLRTYPGRIPMWHASDYHATNRVYTNLGQGSVPYREMFALPRTARLEYLTVEQELTGDIFALLKSDFDYIKQFRWTRV